MSDDVSMDLWIVSLRNFEKVAIHSPLPVMLVFWSNQYSGSDRLTETVRLLAERYRGRVRFGLVDVDDQRELARQLGIGGYPCALVLNQGRLYANVGGELPLTAYKRLLDRLLSEQSRSEQASLVKKIFRFHN